MDKLRFSVIQGGKKDISPESEVVSKSGDIGMYLNTDDYRNFTTFFKTNTFNQPILAHSPVSFTPEELLWFALFAQKGHWLYFYQTLQRVDNCLDNQVILDFRIIAECTHYALIGKPYYAPLSSKQLLIFNHIINRLVRTKERTHAKVITLVHSS